MLYLARGLPLQCQGSCSGRSAMREIMMDGLFWTIVMPWTLFIGLFLVPKNPSWMRRYAFPGFFFVLGAVLIGMVAIGVGIFSLVLGLIAFWVAYESPRAAA